MKLLYVENQWASEWSLLHRDDKRTLFQICAKQRREGDHAFLDKSQSHREQPNCKMKFSHIVPPHHRKRFMPNERKSISVPVDFELAHAC